LHTKSEDSPRIALKYTRIMAKEIKKFVTPNEFAEVINGLNGCQFASIVYVTETESINKKLIGGKKNPYNGKLSSITSISGIQIGANYENAVNNRTEEEFVAEPLPWGEWIRANYLIGHKGNVYLRCYKTKSTNTEVAYYEDGNIVKDSDKLSDIYKNIRSNSDSKRQSEVGIDGKDQVKPFTINITNIMSAVINGVTYIITNVI